MTKLCIPAKVLDQHLIVLGKTGAGKSSALRHIVEHLLDHHKRVCIIDPKGDWWGLKSSADGKHAGYPVIAFGDFKEPKAQDVPINAQSGQHVAELITSGNRPCVIGFRGWMTSHMVQFWMDFAAGIFNANSGELFLVVDEFHNFAPKGKILDPQAGKCLHWSNRLLSEGRGLGIVCLNASQRPQKVHNDSLTSFETLVAMRVVHAADRKAVEEWIKGCGDDKQGREVLASLAGMARGEAFVWSPEIDFGPTRLAFPMFQTFDSFAPPQLQKRISNKGWADVDLSAVKEKLAAVIERAKADDPKELRKQIAELQKQLRSNVSPRPESSRGALPAASTVSTESTKQVTQLRKLLESAMKFLVTIEAKDFFPKDQPIDQSKIEAAIKTAVDQAMGQLNSRLDNERKAIEKWRGEGSRLLRSIRDLLKTGEVPVTVKVQQNKPFTVTPAKSPRTSSNGTGHVAEGLTPRQQRFLDAAATLATLGTDVTRETVAAWVGVHPRGGSVGEELKALADAGLITTDRGRIAITQAGADAAGQVDPAEAIDRAKSGLTNRQAKFFDVIVAAYPDSVTREAIAERFGIHPRGGSLGEDLGRLASRGLITANRGQYTARDFLFAGS